VRLGYRGSEVRARNPYRNCERGKCGGIIIPAKLPKRFDIEEGTPVTTETHEDGNLIRPAVIVPVEKYTPERKEEILLPTATTAKDYQRARKEVRRLGRNADAIPRR
jgi:bifunctional DNA-binding transcriptional regulator/antitoxin component of YhaV-PrlF toxin-antitoxin module